MILLAILSFLVLVVFRPTREFVIQRSPFFIPFLLGGLFIGLPLVTVLGRADIPRWILFLVPFSAGHAVASMTRRHFAEFFGTKKNDNQDDHQ